MGCKMCEYGEKREITTLRPASNNEPKRETTHQNPNITQSFVASKSQSSQYKDVAASVKQLPIFNPPQNININANVHIIINNKLTQPNLIVPEFLSIESLQSFPYLMTLSTGQFRKENKNSIYNNYDILETLGKGMLNQ